MNRRDKNNPPMPNMIWNDKYQMWLDKDARSEKQKEEDEKIAREFELQCHTSECSGCCPCCKIGHCPEENGTSCGANRKLGD